MLEIVPGGVTRRAQISLVVGGTILAGAAAGTVLVAPMVAERAGGVDHPSYAIVALTGIALIALVSAFLGLARRALGLPTACVLLAIGCNALIVTVKFVLSPVSLYQTTFVRGFASVAPGNPGWAYAIGLVTFALYAGTLLAVHRHYRNRVHRALGDERAPRTAFASCGALGLGVGCAALLVVALGIGVAVYLSALLALTGWLLAALLGLMLGCAVATFRIAADVSIELRRVTPLTSLMWLLLSLLALYHVLWVVFMIGLVHLWPLRTVAPSGK